MCWLAHVVRGWSPCSAVMGTKAVHFGLSLNGFSDHLSVQEVNRRLTGGASREPSHGKYFWCIKGIDTFTIV